MFKCFVPLSIEETMEKAQSGAAYVTGIASTSSEDSHGDVVEQGGIDWSPFLKKGWINYEHSPGLASVVGVPVSITKGKKATTLKSKIWGDIDLGKQLIAIMRKAKQEGRSIGYSIEGRVKERDGNRIVSSEIRNVSLVAHPANPDCYADINKALAGAPTMDKEPKYVAESIAKAADKALEEARAQQNELREEISTLRSEVERLRSEPVAKGQVATKEQTHPQESAPEAPSVAGMLEELKKGVSIDRAREINTAIARRSVGLV